MPLSKQQIDTLLTLVVNSTPDSMSCDGCLVNVAQFAEAELMGTTLCDSMQKVQIHLQNCPCCNDEYQALLAALESVVK